ncbi:precorrin-3B C17-methyltransferase [Caldalkalibacillus uzonensis]|uniref:Precorrin-3B C17-methyltransferase n=1 Tax=Caldalkalibacillus uzonensis TaxID=353224 RepID=A0ABU0CPP9_9BACI|nr:precorrin-3B C(17)-methyltransferase [Caldalkalibacillus uzonensis]MDQ0338394.1 precorrin-3B C17-methyltransferase [Caldalkalibacillus uzonensis]
MSGKIMVVGFGPGDLQNMTYRAKEALEESDVIIGYKTYVELISPFLTGQEIVSTGMTEEVSRAQAAVKKAEEGKKVAVISSGDAGLYGMAGLVYEVLIAKGWREETGVPVEIIPGITAINSCASLLGAPVMHDACTISLSDHLTPWELIKKRIEAAAMADFVIALYNPKSGRRTRQILEAQQILLAHRSPETPVGLVKSAYRERQHVVLTTLKEMLEHEIGMLTTVIIGNSTTFVYDGKMITPRGYQRKYTLDKDEQPLAPHERLRQEAEPWALPATDKPAPAKPAETTGTEKKAVDEGAEKTPYQWAMEAWQRLAPQQEAAITSQKGTAISSQAPLSGQVEEIFEAAVSPGLANKQFKPEQLQKLAEVVGEKGSIRYSRHHQLVVEIPTRDPERVVKQLKAAGFLVEPVGDVVQIKACDFCDGEKFDSIPYAEELHKRLGGLLVPKTLKIGFNGCGMACYGAVNDDIGIVYRKGRFDLFLGGKGLSRTAHPGQPVAEGIPPEELVDLIERVVRLYVEEGHPNERFHKFFKRVKEIEGFKYQDMRPPITVEPVACGD